MFCLQVLYELYNHIVLGTWFTLVADKFYEPFPLSWNTSRFNVQMKQLSRISVFASLYFDRISAKWSTSTANNFFKNVRFEKFG